MNPDRENPITRRPYQGRAEQELGRIAHEGTLWARQAAIAELVRRAGEASGAASRIQDAKSTAYHEGVRRGREQIAYEAKRAIEELRV